MTDAQPSVQNRVISQFKAIVRGKETGLAGCGSIHCQRRATCLRADPMLDQRWLPDPVNCRYWIANGEADQL